MQRHTEALTYCSSSSFDCNTWRWYSMVFTSPLWLVGCCVAAALTSLSARTVEDIAIDATTKSSKSWESIWGDFEEVVVQWKASWSLGSGSRIYEVGYRKSLVNKTASWLSNHHILLAMASQYLPTQYDSIRLGSSTREFTLLSALLDSILHIRGHSDKASLQNNVQNLPLSTFPYNDN